MKRAEENRKQQGSQEAGKNVAIREPNGRRNLIVWCVLMLTIVAMSLLTEWRTASVFTIATLSGLKFFLVSLEFMEVRGAHPMYSAWLALLFGGLFVGVLILM